MHDPAWQHAVVAAILGIAAAMVVRRVVHLLRGTRAGCGTGSCETCPAGSQKQQSLVSLTPLAGEQPHYRG